MGNSSAARRLYRMLTGRLALSVYLAVLLMPLVLALAIQFRTLILCRRIHAVLAALQQLHLDQDPEARLLRTVPYLLRGEWDYHDGATLERTYRVRISNDSDLAWMRQLPPFPFPGSAQDTNPVGPVMTPYLKAAYVLGWRYVGFDASVTVRNGSVSRIFYGLEPDIRLGWPVSYCVSVNSAHGFWAEGRRIPVNSTDEQSPNYRVIGTTSYVHAAYTVDAPPTSVSHAFQLDLGCFWGLRRCHSASQIAPLLWKDKQVIEAAAIARLKSQTPCPDTILADRVRYLPDVTIDLRQVLDIQPGTSQRPTVLASYRIKEIVQGRLSEHVPNTTWPTQPKPGDKVLFFSGVDFESCQAVPATPSAEATVRSTPHAFRHHSDNLSGMWGAR